MAEFLLGGVGVQAALNTAAVDNIVHFWIK